MILKKKCKLFIIGLFILISGIPATLLANESSYEMQNMHMNFYADSLWLFYRCGDDLYFNHELRNRRDERNQSLNFAWTQSQTLLGLRYCDGYGHPFLKTKVAHADVTSLVLADKLELYYRPQNAPTTISKVVYRGGPTALPNANKWSQASTVKTSRNQTIYARHFEVVEHNGESYVIYTDSKGLRVLRPDGKLYALNLNHPLNYDIKFRATTVWNKSGPQLLVVYPTLNSDKTFGAVLYDYESIKRGRPEKIENDLRWFYNGNDVSEFHLLAQLSGKVSLYFVRNGQQSEATLDIENLTPTQFNPHSGLTQAYQFQRESKAFNVFQAAMACDPSRGCTLVNFSYPKRARFALSQTQNLHPQYGGKVVAKALKNLPIRQTKMELVGIIEGPPPVPLQNIMASLKVVPDAFVLDAARGLSRFIKTSISQSMSVSSTASNETISTRVHALSVAGGTPMVSPITMSAMSTITKKLAQAQSLEETTTIKKTYANEIQHTAVGDTKRLIMRPIGKLIFMKYDVNAFRYVFLDESGKENENGPVLLSIGKTNIRPVIRQYEILGKQVKPEKYPHGLIVGDIHSYASFQRRHSLMNKAQLLAPGHNYLSYTYNNVLDLGTEINIQTTHTDRRTVSESFALEGSLGTGFEKLFGAEFKMQREEERIIGLENSRSEGMAINVEMNYVQPTDDERVLHYDFEVYYLNPSQDNYRDIREELLDTQSQSSLNREALNDLAPGSRPWKVTYSVSDIRQGNPPK